jgi:hypothetical protein
MNEQPKQVECIYCGYEVVERDVPDLDDNESWSVEAQQHDPTCEWVMTRAFRIPDGYKWTGRSLEEDN